MQIFLASQWRALEQLQLHFTSLIYDRQNFLLHFSDKCIFCYPASIADVYSDVTKK